VYTGVALFEKIFLGLACPKAKEETFQNEDFNFGLSEGEKC